MPAFLPILIQSLLTAQPLTFPVNDPNLIVCIDHHAKEWGARSTIRSLAAEIVWTSCNSEWRKARLKASLSASLFTPQDQEEAALKDLERKYLLYVDERIAAERSKVIP